MAGMGKSTNTEPLDSLAYAELRIILAKLLWNFDFQLALESQNWLDEQAQYLLWERGPLNMKLRRNNIHK